jgi:hypothetical protein
LKEINFNYDSDDMTEDEKRRCDDFNRGNLLFKLQEVLFKYTTERRSVKLTYDHEYFSEEGSFDYIYELEDNPTFRVTPKP